MCRSVGWLVGWLPSELLHLLQLLFSLGATITLSQSSWLAQSTMSQLAGQIMAACSGYTMRPASDTTNAAPKPSS